MNYGEIKFYDIADGTGVRTSLFVSGCRNCCEDCFNRETWSFSYGKPYTQETENAIIESLKPDYIAGLSILGGEPFEKENQPEVLKLVPGQKRMDIFRVHFRGIARRFESVGANRRRDFKTCGRACGRAVRQDEKEHFPEVQRKRKSADNRLKA